MRRLGVMLCVALLSAGSLAADKLPLDAISGYLNKLQTAQGAFTQINDDGTISTGTIYIRRPGRMRFEYDPPETTLVVVGQGAVVIDDKKSNQGTETYPLNRTPLSIMLAETVDLRQARMVTGHAFDGTATVVTAQDPKTPEQGEIAMYFTSEPVQLRQWVIKDGNGNATTMILGELETGLRLRNALFNTKAIGDAGNR